MKNVVKKKHQTKSEILAEKISELSYGDFISHEQIAAIIGEAYGSNKYSSTIAKAKKILLNIRICIQRFYPLKTQEIVLTLNVPTSLLKLKVNHLEVFQNLLKV